MAVWKKPLAAEIFIPHQASAQLHRQHAWIRRLTPTPPKEQKLDREGEWMAGSGAFTSTWSPATIQTRPVTPRWFSSQNPPIFCFLPHQTLGNFRKMHFVVHVWYFCKGKKKKKERPRRRCVSSRARRTGKECSASRNSNLIF